MCLFVNYFVTFLLTEFFDKGEKDMSVRIFNLFGERQPLIPIHYDQKTQHLFNVVGVVAIGSILFGYNTGLFPYFF